METVSKDYLHAVTVDEDICIGCSHCVKVCPTEALRVWSGKAIIDDTKCVDCGDCYRVCPVKAIFVKEDDLDLRSNDHWNVALLPAVFWGQFTKDISREKIVNAIYRAGFQQIFDVEESVEPLSNEIEEYLKQAQGHNKISSFCPAVVRLIQTRFPELISSIVHLKSPVEITAKHISEKLKREKPDSNVSVYYITPCAAKAATLHNSKDKETYIDASINMNVFYNKISKYLKLENTVIGTPIPEDQLSPKSIGWSLRGGEGNHLSVNTLSIDGMNHCIEYLENIEKEDFKEIDFLELKACDQGCAGGILNPQNRFLCVESVKSRSTVNAEKENSIPKLFVEKDDFKIDEIEDRSVLALDKNPAQALKMMNKTRRMMCYLPGFDCGACGAPTCKSLAEDVAKGDAILSHCVFMQRQMEKHHRLSPDHAFNIIESIWGKDRLDKDCTKKGAINDY